MYTYLPQNRIGYSFWILCTSCNCTVDLAVETMIWDSFYETKRRDRKKIKNSGNSRLLHSLLHSLLKTAVQQTNWHMIES